MRAGIADIFGICKRNLGVKQEVDIKLCGKLVFCALENASRVNKEVNALLGINKSKVGVIIIHCKKIACKIRCKSRFARLHFQEYLIVDICGNDVFLLFEQLRRNSPSCGRLVVIIHSKNTLSNRKGISRIVNHQNVVGIALIPKRSPAVGSFLDHFGVINQADHSDRVGHGIFVCGVMGEVSVFLGNVFIVRNVAEIKLFEHILRNHSLYHIVGGNNHIV